MSLQLKKLPYDYSRCSAVSTDEGEIVMPCKNCLRWIDRKTDSPWQSWIMPKRKNDGTCDNLIDETK